MDQILTARKEWMGVLARAPAGRVSELTVDIGGDDALAFLRPPEIGSVMVRGCSGGTGAPFNLGEMTVTRCSVKLACGAVGHAYVQGRRKDDAARAALVDALLQTGRGDEIRARVIDPLKAEEIARRRARSAKAAATKVEFFTMVRGED